MRCSIITAVLVAIGESLRFGALQGEFNFLLAVSLTSASPIPTTADEVDVREAEARSVSFFQVGALSNLFLFLLF